MTNDLYSLYEETISLISTVIPKTKEFKLKDCFLTNNEYFEVFLTYNKYSESEKEFDLNFKTVNSSLASDLNLGFTLTINITHGIKYFYFNYNNSSYGSGRVLDIKQYLEKVNLFLTTSGELTSAPVTQISFRKRMNLLLRKKEVETAITIEKAKEGGA